MLLALSALTAKSKGTAGGGPEDRVMMETKLLARRRADATVVGEAERWERQKDKRSERGEHRRTLSWEK